MGNANDIEEGGINKEEAGSLTPDAAGEDRGRRAYVGLADHLPEHTAHLLEVDLAILVDIELTDELLHLHRMRPALLPHSLQGSAKEGKELLN